LVTWEKFAPDYPARLVQWLQQTLGPAGAARP